MLLVVSVAVIDRTAAFPSWWAILPVLGSVLVIFGGATAWGVAPLFTNRVAVWFGLISYPLYLWHWPVLSFLHIAEDDVPHRDARIAGVLLAILLAWLTYRLIERPIRFGTFREPARSLWLAAIMVAVGLAGFVISRTDFSDTHTARSVYLRGGLEHRIGPSSRWFEGRDDWLFLGNSYDRTVAKLRSDSPPPPDEVVDTRALCRDRRDGGAIRHARRPDCRPEQVVGLSRVPAAGTDARGQPVFRGLRAGVGRCPEPDVP